MASKATILQFERGSKKGLWEDPLKLSNCREDYFYTLDMILHDERKEHVKAHCVLCEPMKLLGCHRDVAMSEIALTMVSIFFETYEDYKEQVKSIVVENLLKRDGGGRSFPDLKTRVQDLIMDQLKNDVSDFMSDIERHLLKYTNTELPSDRREAILQDTLKILQEKWIIKP